MVRGVRKTIGGVLRGAKTFMGTKGAFINENIVYAAYVDSG